MASKQISRRQKAMTLVPLALVSGAWTASLAGVNSATAAGDKISNEGLPDGTSVPSQAIEAPANLPSTGVIAPGVPAGTADQVVDGASTSGIPSSALSAYQRAAQIINSADKTCRVPWELVAAIGRVESDHGRYGGNVLSRNGVSTPGIYGIQLNGKNGTQPIQDTDGAALDKDSVWDRAVGPMQFIPSTWQVVKVDADGDGKRNPQDIDDASLATAVYLCSGEDDLSKEAGQKKAVFRYNHSEQYVDLVLRLMQAYMDGDYTAVPDDAQGGSIFSSSGSTAMNETRKKAQTKKDSQTPRGGSNGGGGNNGGGNGGGGNGGGDGDGGLGGGGLGGGGGDGLDVPDGNGGTTNIPVPPPVQPAADLLNSLGEAIAFCNSQISGLPAEAAQKCAQRIVGKTKDEAAALIPNTLTATLKWLGLGSLLGGLGLG